MTRMIWVGGAPGAGKSTLARALALAEDLAHGPAAAADTHTVFPSSPTPR